MNKKKFESGAGVSLRINGALLAVGRRPDLRELEAPLRGIALSDSPVLIRAGDGDRDHLVDRLHALGRRATLPCHDCRSPDQAEELFRSILEAKDEGSVAGTWVLHHVDAWPRELQANLERVLETLDEDRLHGRKGHHSLPRVVVLESADSDLGGFDPELRQRLSYFNVTVLPTEARA